MNTRHLVDPELLPFIDNIPPITLSDETLPQMRAGIESAAVLGDPSSVGVLREERYLSGLNGGPDIRCLVYRPNGKLDGAPGYVHLHGGGYIAGLPEISDRRSMRIASELGAVVVSVDYRLAPEHPFPAALDDAYAALAWLHAKAGALGVDPDRIAVGGESAGGGLAAALALRARDDGRYPIAFQLLVYPMLDDRTGGPDAPGDPMLGEFVWTRESNQFAWPAYLGGAPATAYAAPARAENLEGLPPTCICAAALDLFLDDDVAYARRLLGAGVHTELQVYPSAFHGFGQAVEASVSQRHEEDYLHALRRALAPRTNITSRKPDGENI